MKKSFALRVDEEVYDALEKWAASEFRSRAWASKRCRKNS